jgi:hypothetical protein
MITPLVPKFSMPVADRFMTRFPYWPSIRKFRRQLPMRAPDPLWAAFLLSIAKDQSCEIQDWRELRKAFGVTVTKDVEVTQAFFCSGVKPCDRLGCQWIGATNKLENYVNHELQSWPVACCSFSSQESE